MEDVKYDSEKLKADAEQYLSNFKLRMSEVAEQVMGDLYTNCLPHIETDSWTNYRESLRLELEHQYKYSEFKHEWAINLRRAIFVENREELAELLDKDLLKRIKELEDRVKEFEMFRYTAT